MLGLLALSRGVRAREFPRFVRWQLTDEGHVCVIRFVGDEGSGAALDSGKRWRLLMRIGWRRKVRLRERRIRIRWRGRWSSAVDKVGMSSECSVTRWK